MADAEWERRAELLWESLDSYSEPDFVAAMRSLVAELPGADPVGPFELAGAYDTTGQPELAAPLYQQALAGGLPASQRRQAVIQLASTLRNLERADESVALLTAELDAGSDELDDAVRAFLALALTSVGRDREAVAITLTALAGHLPRYRRAVTAYAAELR
ncbi:MAG TPA: tetratricopeptide repeat protein [Mycobacteriales bacterium]|nr:tetratricopeptide repeat protein [Mycobacteriales bacterium]